MSKYFLFGLLILATGIAVWWSTGRNLTLTPTFSLTESLDTNGQRSTTSPSVIAGNLEVPWDVAFLPNDELLVSERSGRLLLIEAGNVTLIQTIEEVVKSGEGGLLGITLHPHFADNHFIYIYMTVSVGRELVNTVVRYVYEDRRLTFDRIILDHIPASRNHDGGRIEFGPDGYLYITTGDAGNEPLAQDWNSLAGKILRVTDRGEIPNSNPFGTAVYSFGHRNPQGLAWDDVGRLWSTEHGRSGIRSGYDEVNLIISGNNYGWPESQGDTVLDDTTGPAWHSGANDTWAPASLVFWDDSLFFGGLRGQALYEAVLDGERIIEVREHFKGEYGRIRTVRLGPDNMFYLTTSNRDGRGQTNSADDRLVRLDPRMFR